MTASESSDRMNGEKCQEWQSTGSGNQPVVAINQLWQSTGGGNQPVVAINQQ